MRSLALVSMALLPALGACGRSKPAQPAQPAPAVETATVASRQLRTTDRLPAQLLPYEMVDVYPRVTGFLDEIRVDVGARVRKGDLLARLSAPEMAAQRAQAEAGLRTAEAQLGTAQARLASDQGTYLRLQAAAKTSGVVAENDLMVAGQTTEADRGGVAAAEHGVSAARDALRAVTQMESYLTIVAPFAGVVTRRNLHPGALVGPASGPAGAAAIVQLVDIDRLRLVVPVPEAEVGVMKPDQPVSFTVPAFLGKTFTAPIARISHDIDLQTRTMHVELDVQNQDGTLSPGSFATVIWPVERGYPTLFVPVSAVSNDQQRTFVIRVTNGTAEWVTVQTGQTVKGEIEVAGDLHPGDTVLRSASDAIRNGQPLSVAPR